MECLSRNSNTDDSDQEITGMNINMNAISTAVNMPVCIFIKDIQASTEEANILHVMWLDTKKMNQNTTSGTNGLLEVNK